MPGALATSLDEPDRPQRSVSKTLKRAVSSYFVPRGRFKKLLESAENDNEADVYRRNVSGVCNPSRRLPSGTRGDVGVGRPVKLAS